MNNFQVVSFEGTDKKQLIGFIHDSSATKTRVLFVEGNDIRFYATTPRINRDQMLRMLKCQPVDESQLHDDLKERRHQLMNPVTFKKGECASFEDEGKTVQGRVIKGGKNRIIIAINNGRTDIEINAIECKPVELPEVTGPMKDWEVGSYKIVRGHDDSIPYVADILHKGKKALIGENDGWGGSDMFSLGRGTKRAVLDQFYADLNESVKQATGTTDGIHEPEGLWVTWDYYVRPSGEQSFEEYLKDHHEAVSSMVAKAKASAR